MEPEVRGQRTHPRAEPPLCETGPARRRPGTSCCSDDRWCPDTWRRDEPLSRGRGPAEQNTEGGGGGERKREREGGVKGEKEREREGGEREEERERG